MRAAIRKQVEAATVKFPPKGHGQGVVVPGSAIATAAHILQWTGTGAMTLDSNECVAQVKIGKRTVFGEVWALEPVSDMALLAAPDAYNLCEAFEEVIENIAPIPICTTDFEPRVPFTVHMLTHTCEWIKGQAQVMARGSPLVWVEASRQIEGGTSGGPIVTDDGQLVAVVSHFSETGGACDGSAPRPHLTLPVWLVRELWPETLK